MTPTSIVSADFIEIGAVDIHCKCGGVVSIPIPLPLQGLKEKIPTSFSCPSCNIQLWNDNSPAYNHILQLLTALGDWKRDKEKSKFWLGFTLPSS
jgi:hypothetical protein